MSPCLGRCLFTQRELEKAYNGGLTLVAAIIESVDRSEARKEQVDGDLGGAFRQTDLLSLAFQGPTLYLNSYCLLFIKGGQDGSHFHCFDSDIDLTRDSFVTCPLDKSGHIIRV